MNKNFILKLLSVISAVLLCLPVFVSCQKEPKKTDTTDGTTAPTTEQSDDKEGVWDYTRDPSLPDFAAMVTLNDSNLKQDFDKTGRGLVTVEQYIDGDTVHFWNYSRTVLIKARFVAIDTPESTGKVEPWGKPASKYTKAKLEKAAPRVFRVREFITRGKNALESGEQISEL